MEEIIKIDNLSKIYKQGDIQVDALKDISLNIKPKEFTVIAGPSGSGKTTLLNMIGGLDVPSNGDIYLEKTLISKMSQTKLTLFRRNNIGFIFQSFNLIPVLNVEENIEYIMLLQNIEKTEIKKRIKEILEDVGLKDMQKRRPHQLSGGQQQRVAIARAMVSHPKIILADEPTANVDSKTGIELINMMLKLNKEKNMTFLFSTHDEDIIKRARRVIYIRDGKIQKDTRENK